MSDSVHLLPERLVSWIEETMAGAITRVIPRAGGGAVRSGAEIFLNINGDELHAFLAYDGGSRLFTGVRDKYLREASLLRAIEDTDIRAPRLLASDPDQRAHLFEFVTGEDRFIKIQDPDQALAIATEFVGELVKLHQLDASQVALEGFGELKPTHQYIEARLDEMEAEHVEAGPPDPFITAGLQWLGRNIPQYEGPTVIVHGDAGPGNFLFDDTGINTVLDWELAHYGDPLEDFAWMSIRSIIQAWVPFPPLLKAYEEQSGIKVDLNRIRFYRIYTLIGMMIGSHRRYFQQPESLADQRGLGNGLMFTMVHRRAYVHGLADAMGIDLADVVLPEGQPSGMEPYIASLLGQLRDTISARTDDQVIIETAKDMARVLKYLDRRAQLAESFDKDELDDLGQVMNSQPESLPIARSQLVDLIEKDALSNEVLIGILWRRVSRETAMMQTAMGALSERLFPPLV